MTIIIYLNHAIEHYDIVTNTAEAIKRCRELGGNHWQQI